ncbi:hypothetical protein M9Y10_029431 [Tritrichomonas musculus]|uniref:N-acetyltransferase domain-containing protein n=1 Tax=Tritrichomonas musculus TaxID=1915356 RepID=A0ABR2KM24_9EUKA
MISSFFKRGISIRKAGPEDCEFVVGCIGKLTQMVLNSKTMPINIGIRESYHDMMKDPDHYPIFIAEEKDKDNKIIKLGTAVTSTQIMLHMGGKYLYVQELIVDDAARGKGVGSALLKYVDQYSKDQGYFAVELTQPPDSTKYHKERTAFYTQHGYDMNGRSRSKKLKNWLKFVD